MGVLLQHFVSHENTNVRMKNMKRKKLNMTKAILCMCILSFMLCSCNKEKEKEENAIASERTNGHQLSTLELSSYFQESEKILHEFWVVCDRAYTNNREVFLQACCTNDLSAFLSSTGITAEQLEKYKATITAEREQLEHDYPGICDQYRESPCHDCQQTALNKIGNLVASYEGTYAQHASKASPKMCIFVCSMACMTTLEFYIPCLAACSTTCIKY